MDEREIYTKLYKLIDNFGKPKTGVLVKRRSLIDNREASIKFSGKKFLITFNWDIDTKDGKRLNLGKHYKKVEFRFKDQSLILNDFFLGKHSPPRFTGQSSFLYTKGYSLKRKFYYRLVVPLEKQLNFHYTIGSRMATIDGDSLEFKVTQADKKKYYLVIESKLKQSYDIFSEKTFALKNAIGYLTGYLAGNGGYFFAYTKQKMETPTHIYRCEFRDTIISSYSPIYSNPYGYIRQRKLAEKYYQKKLLRQISQDELSLLCQRLYDSVELSSAIILMLETSVASLLFMPGGYAIVLETLADIIKSKEKQKVAPMTKSISRKIRKECTETAENYWQKISDEFSEIINKYQNVISFDCLSSLNKYKDSITEDNLNTLKKRIEGINKATNKAQLRRPFDYLEIDLSERDIEILGTRDDFLHGRVPDMTKAGENRSLDRQNKDLYYASVRMYTLLNMLILKWIGYDNRVVNYPKINDAFTEIKLKEEPFRQV